MSKRRNRSTTTSPEQYASYGLWLAAAGFISALILGFMKLLVFIGQYTPSDPKMLNLMFWISLGLAVIGPCLYAILNPKGVREFFSGRQGRHGSNALVLTLAVLGILVVVNMIVYQNPKEWDLTEDKQHTLAPETLDTLKALPENVTALAFYSMDTPSDTAIELLGNYQAKSDGKFQFRLIDPDTNPIPAQQAGVTRSGTIVLQMGDRKEAVTYASEQELTGALVRLMHPETHTVYFLVGHGEHDSVEAGESSVNQVKLTLESKNYTVKTINLIAGASIPSDADMVIIAGPTKPVSANEVALLEKYLNEGGSLILMTEPRALTEFGDSPDPLAEMLAKNWGITLNDDLAIDPTANPAYVAVAGQYAAHSITDKLDDQAAFFPHARSLTVDSGLTDKTVVALVTSTGSAWGETDIKGLENSQPAFDQAADTPGPLTLAATAESNLGDSRVVVFGDSDFATDAVFSQYANGSLIINAVDWAAGQEDIISLTPKEPVQRTFKMLTLLQQVGVGLGGFCLIPGLVLAGGLIAWLARRRRG